MANPSGPEGKYNIIYDFSHDWVTFNHDLKAFIPYFGSEKQKNKSLSLKINLDDYPNSVLVLKSDVEGSFLFFNKTLSKQIKKGQWYVFPTNNLKNQLSKSELVLTVYGQISPENLTIFSGFKGNITPVTLSNEKTSSNLSLIPRNNNPINSSLAIIFLLNVVMISFLSNNYIKAYKKYYNLYDLTSVVQKESTFLINKPMDRPNMLFIILLSLMGGFMVIITQKSNYQILDDSMFFRGGNTFGIIISNYFKISLIVFIAFISKYFYILTFGKLFNIEKIVDVHFFKIVQSSLFFFTFYIIVLLIAQNLHLNITDQIPYLVKIGFLIFYILRTILIYFTINQKGNIKTLYLISYLCIVELFPVIVGFRLLF